MEHISVGLMDNLLDFIGILEARELNRESIRTALERGGYDRWPELRDELERCTAGVKNSSIESTPPGMSPPAEALWRLKRLHESGCPRHDVEGALGFFITVNQFPYGEAASFVFGKEVLGVRE